MGAKRAWGQTARPEVLSLAPGRIPKAHSLPVAPQSGVQAAGPPCACGGTPVLERRHAYLISPLAHFELDLIEHPDTTNPAKSDIVSTLMHIHLGVIKNKNTAPWGLFKDRRESSDFPSVYSGVIK